jgi:hypothetical protein
MLINRPLSTREVVGRCLAPVVGSYSLGGLLERLRGCVVGEIAGFVL